MDLANCDARKQCLDRWITSVWRVVEKPQIAERLGGDEIARPLISPWLYGVA